jgi:hypothetical protein
MLTSILALGSEGLALGRFFEIFNVYYVCELM